MPALIVSALVWLFIAYVVVPVWEFVVIFWPLILSLIVVLIFAAIFWPQRDKKLSSQSPSRTLSNPDDKARTPFREPERSLNSTNWRNGITSYDTERIIGRHNPNCVTEKVSNPGLEGGLSKEAAATIFGMTRSAEDPRRKGASLGSLPSKTTSGRNGTDRQRLAPEKNSVKYVPPGVPTHGLVILEEHLNKILQGRKTMELRSKHNRQMGLIALIRKGSGKIYGVAEIVESIGPMSFDEFRTHAHEHAIEPEMLREIFEKGWDHGWRLRNVVTLKSPVSYIHNRGAVVKVKLNSDAIEELSRQLARV